MQSILFEIPVELPIVVTSNVHFCENNAEHALVKAMVALIRPIRRNARPIADAVNHLQSKRYYLEARLDYYLEERLDFDCKCRSRWNLGENFLRNTRARSIPLQHDEQRSVPPTSSASASACMPPAHMSRPRMPEALLAMALMVPGGAVKRTPKRGVSLQSPACV